MLSLADELGEVFSADRRKSFVSGLRDSECRSPDSGISLVHSPERAKSSSPQQIGNVPASITLPTTYIIIRALPTYRNETLKTKTKTIVWLLLCADTPTPASSCSSAGLPLSQLELLEATHRGLYKFVPRHRDEMEVDIGDPIYVQKEAEDCWCEGIYTIYWLFLTYTPIPTTTLTHTSQRILLNARVKWKHIWRVFRSEPSHWSSRRVSVCVRGRRRVHGVRCCNAQGETRTVSVGVHGFGRDDVAQRQFRAVSSHTQDHRTTKLQTTIVHTRGVGPRTPNGRSSKIFYDGK